MTLINYLFLFILLASAQCKSQKIEKTNATGLAASPSGMPSENHTSINEILKDARDFTPYRLAIENAHPFDTIRIPSEIFAVKTPITVGTDNLTISCDGCTLLMNFKANLFMVKDVRGLTLSGIHAKSMEPSSGNLVKIHGGSNLSVIGCQAENMGLLFLEKGAGENVHKDLLVNKSSAINAAADGIKLQAVQGFAILNSKFINCKKDGIKTNLAPCDQGLIRNCYFESNDDDGFDLFGGGSNILVDSSTFVDSKIQLKNIGGQYYRSEIKNCTLRHNKFINTAVICLSKFIPNTEFQGLSGIVIDNNQWINDRGSCFQSNGAVSYQFTNNHLLLKNGQTALDIRPPLGEGMVQNNIIESGITRLDTDPKKGVYLLHTKPQSDKNFGVRDENSNLRIEGNQFINGRRDFVLDGLANYNIEDNVSIGQSDKSIYLGVDKVSRKESDNRFRRTVSNNKLLKEPPGQQ